MAMQIATTVSWGEKTSIRGSKATNEIGRRKEVFLAAKTCPYHEWSLRPLLVSLNSCAEDGENMRKGHRGSGQGDRTQKKIKNGVHGRENGQQLVR